MNYCVLEKECSVYDRVRKFPGVSLSSPLCEGCRNRAVSELNMLRYDYIDLSQLIPKKQVQSEANIARTKPESSPPLDVGVLTLRSDIASTLSEAEVRLREYLGARPRPQEGVREGFGLDAAIRYLDPHVEHLARLPAGDGVGASGVEYLLRLSELHRAARRVCGLDARTITVPGECPVCLVPSLRRHDDDPERVWCCRCHQVMSKQAYYAAQRMQFAPSQPGA